MKKIRRQLMNGPQFIPLAIFRFLFPGKHGGWDRYPQELGQFVNRVRKTQALIVHEKRKDIAPQTAAEAMKNLFFFVNRQGGRLFLVERTKPQKIPSSLL
jgi:hypothetical protein